MKDRIQVNIDGTQVESLAGETVLEAAQRAGVEIPTLCHDSRLDPAGCCRMCLVEVEGERRLQPALYRGLRASSKTCTGRFHLPGAKPVDGRGKATGAFIPGTALPTRIRLVLRMDDTGCSGGLLQQHSLRISAGIAAQDAKRTCKQPSMGLAHCLTRHSGL